MEYDTNFEELDFNCLLNNITNISFDDKQVIILYLIGKKHKKLTETLINNIDNINEILMHIYDERNYYLISNDISLYLNYLTNDLSNKNINFLYKKINAFKVAKELLK